MFYNDKSSQNMKTKCKLKQKSHQNKIPKRFFGKFLFSYFLKIFFFYVNIPLVTVKIIYYYPKSIEISENFLLLKLEKENPK